VSPAGTREIFYARYIDWFITTPLLITDLLLTAAVPWPTIIATIVADEIMIVTGLIGALTQTRYKWGYWVFGMAAFMYVVYVLLVVGRRSATILGGPVKSTYYACGMLTIGIWFLYPIAWGLAEGGNVIHPDSEAIFYGILDLIAKPVFSFMLLIGHSRIDFNSLGLGVSELGYPNVYANRPDTNKGAHSGQNNGVHNGAHNGAHDGSSVVATGSATAAA
jgi:bacteriorhodopsin